MCFFINFVRHGSVYFPQIAQITPQIAQIFLMEHVQMFQDIYQGKICAICGK